MFFVSASTEKETYQVYCCLCAPTGRLSQHPSELILPLCAALTFQVMDRLLSQPLMTKPLKSGRFTGRSFSSLSTSTSTGSGVPSMQWRHIFTCTFLCALFVWGWKTLPWVLIKKCKFLVDFLQMTDWLCHPVMIKQLSCGTRTAESVFIHSMSMQGEYLKAAVIHGNKQYLWWFINNC